MTEYIYARSLQTELPRDLQRSVSIEIFYQNQNDPKSLALEARRRARSAVKERNAYDTIWLFFDNDRWPQLGEAFEIINREGFRIAYTAICIEHWFILHFENCGRAFPNAEAAIKYLNKLWPRYHKTRSNVYRELKEQLAIAIKRADRINSNHESGSAVHERNPYFSVQELINFFEELKSED